MTVYIYTFGCKVNQYESDCIMELMTKKGFIQVNSIKLADIIIINTCTVTGSADVKLRQLLNRIERENPNAITAVCGCYAQAYGISSILSDIDIIVGESNKSKLPELIQNYISEKKRYISIIPHSKQELFEPMKLSARTDKTRAIIKIQDGCDRFCSYCIIPYARGRSRSKPLCDIAAEAKGLAGTGYLEVVIVGINLSCYGEDFHDGTTLADAVAEVCKSGEVKRVRLGSIEPEMLTDKIIDELAECEQLCPQFHLSLQSGCDKTLKQMRRKYDTKQYSELVNKLRERFPKCSITTDVMVGFAGETQDDFYQSLEYVKSMGFSKIHVFPYSERKGTAAAERSDQVPVHERKRRAQIMSEVSQDSENSYLMSLVGKQVEVLFEKEKESEWHQGYAKDYSLIKIKRTQGTLRRQIRNVRIISAENGYCIGKLI